MSRLHFHGLGSLRVKVTVYGNHSVRYLRSALWSQIDRKFRELKTVDQLKSDQEGRPRQVKTVLYVLFIIVMLN